ncbi:MAG: hypothetical protein K8R74_12445 [Bacteroidales bacterium]|nr:hypothetical protein [Bacteroidales bacterium]
MTDSKFNQYKIWICLASFIAIFTVFILITPPQDPYLNFEGTLAYPHTINLDSVNLNFKAGDLVVNSDVVVYRYVKDVIIEKDGIFESLNGSHLEVRYKENNYFTVKNATTYFVFDNSTQIKAYNNYIYVVGSTSKYLHKAIETDSNVSIMSNQIKSVRINGEEYLEGEFDNIHINTGTGYADLYSEKIIFFAYDVSNYVLSSFCVDSFYMQGSEGNIAINGDTYRIINVNVLDFSLKNEPYSTNFLIKNDAISIDSTAKSAHIDGKDIIKSNISYLFDQQIEKISAFATIILVGVTIHYALSTHNILNQSTRAEKRSYIEKRLENLYYPLRDFIESPEVFKYYYYDEIMDASVIEAQAEEYAREKGVQYMRPSNSILTNYDVLNTSAKRYKLDSIIPYKYLATNELLVELELLLSDFRDIETVEPASSDPEFKNRIDKIKLLIKNDIEKLLETHKELI